MREGKFISKNKERWEEYLNPTNDPDELAKRFVCLIDDLGYAKTHYPGSGTTKYLNGIAANIYLSIYKDRKERSNRLKHFAGTELPLIMYRNRKTLLATFLFFIIFMTVGIFSSWQDQTLVRTVLGEAYVDMTLENIQSGDPFKIYKDSNPFSMFLQITFNNIRVTFTLFFSGLFLSLGTIYILFNNSLMLGVFEQMFFAHNLGAASILAVFIHGTLEISGLIIAATAGIVLGNSIIFPGTYSRAQSLVRGAKDGIKIIIGLIPIFITAGFFESYVTRYYDRMPVWLNVLILIGSLAFILFYFVYYPQRVANKIRKELSLPSPYSHTEEWL